MSPWENGDATFKMEQRDEADLEYERRNQEFLDFGFGWVKFKTPISHPNSNVKRQLNI